MYPTSNATEATDRRMLQMDAASKAVDGSINCRLFDIYNLFIVN